MEVEDVAGGALLRFLGSSARDRRPPRPPDDAKEDSWDAADAKWAAAAAARQPAPPVREGALLIVAEAGPSDIDFSVSGGSGLHYGRRPAR